jgi:hypothetical protein
MKSHQNHDRKQNRYRTLQAVSDNKLHSLLDKLKPNAILRSRVIVLQCSCQNTLQFYYYVNQTLQYVIDFFNTKMIRYTRLYHL